MSKQLNFPMVGAIFQQSNIIGELYAHTSRMLYFCESCMQNHVHANAESLDSKVELKAWPFLPGRAEEEKNASILNILLTTSSVTPC